MKTKYLVLAVCVAVLAVCNFGCATYTFKCAKTVGFSVNPDANPACLTGLCDGEKTVVLEGPGPADFLHLCDPDKMHWFKGDKLTCIPDPCVPLGQKMMFTPDGGLACGNQ